MLTGDKLETAESIARSCNLITNKMNLITIKELDKCVLNEKLLFHCDNTNFDPNTSLIVDGASLGTFLNQYYIYSFFNKNYLDNNHLNNLLYINLYYY